MTPKQRIDRLERIALLMTGAGLRLRTQVREHKEKIDLLINNQIRYEEESERRRREQDEKIEIMINAQIRYDHESGEVKRRHEDRLAALNERATETQKRTDEHFLQFLASQEQMDRRFDSLVASQARTDKRLVELIALLRQKQRGKESI